MKEQLKDKNEFVTTFVAITITFFSCKNVSQILCKIFSTYCFFTDDMKHKTLNKTTCRMLSASPLPTMCILVENLSNHYDCFSRLSGFPDLICKVFWINFKFSSFDYSTILLHIYTNQSRFCNYFHVEKFKNVSLA